MPLSLYNIATDKLFSSTINHNNRLLSHAYNLQHYFGLTQKKNVNVNFVLFLYIKFHFVLSQNNLSVSIRLTNLIIIHTVSHYVERTRTRSASFPNSVVFPGGVSEPVDGSPRWLEHFESFGYTEKDYEPLHRPTSVITPIFQNNPIQRHIQLRITAIRETFEELGLLVCSRKRKEDRAGLWADIIDNIDVKYWQNRLNKDPGDLLSLCEEHQCYPDIWALHYWSNWLSPTRLQKRFDTAFFVAALETKPKGIEVTSEVAKVEWLSPTEVINSDKKLYPPQLYELHRLAHVKDITELTAFAKERSGHGTDLSYPFFVKAKDGSISLLPGDDLYPTSIDYNDNTVKYIDKTILELREGCKTLHRFELKKETKQFIVQNYKPKHHINMEYKTYPAYLAI